MNQPPKCNSAVPVRYTWDGENRLKAVEPMTPVNDVSRKAEFAYDYLPLTRVRRSLGVASRHVPHGGTRRVKGGCRRVQKKVYNRTSGAWVLASDERFVYDGPALDTPGHGASQGWNVVMVLDGQASNATLRKYTWGLDLSGLAGVVQASLPASGIHGAGGIGGLLAVEETAATNSPAYWFFYDGNGNVGQVIRASDQSLAARYEYDPYGDVLIANGDYAATNPYRFSTRWFDPETGAGSWPHRYYLPRLGRWLNRDPIGEKGGPNLYCAVRNGTTNSTDALGQQATRPATHSCGECLLEYRSSLVLVATHLGLAVDATKCPRVGKKFNVQFGPEFFPLALGKLVSYPTWTSPVLEAKATADCDKCECLFRLHTRRYKADYLLTGPNCNSALNDTIGDCGLTLPPLRTPLIFFWGLTTDPGDDDKR